MQFLGLLSQLRDQYGGDVVFTDNQACLLGPRGIPQIADHVLYAPMPDSVGEHLVKSYRRNFPEDLLELYAYANGMDLFRTMRKITEEICLPASKLSIYGMPILGDRKHLEPLSICLEDLSRLPDTPENWLKFGCRRDICQGETKNEYDLYVDTDGGKAYQTEREGASLSIVRTWASIDGCLCGLLEEMQATGR